jgi:surfactin synthase thioesterase subunit
VFQPWSDWLGDEIEIISVELPGHGMRYREKLVPSAEEIAAQIIPHVLNFFDKPICFLGHSMGAYLALETVRQLKEVQANPNHLYVIGAYPPHIKRKQITHQSDEDFLQEVFQLGGVPEEVVRDTELQAYLLPILRNDFCLTERYEIKGDIACPLTVYAGDKDIVSQRDIQRWMEIKSKGFSWETFKGDHFFLHKEHADFQITLKESLLQQLN